MYLEVGEHPGRSDSALALSNPPGSHPSSPVIGPTCREQTHSPSPLQMAQPSVLAPTRTASPLLGTEAKRSSQKSLHWATFPPSHLVSLQSRLADTALPRDFSERDGQDPGYVKQRCPFLL